MSAYYRKHPDRLMDAEGNADPRHIDAVAWSGRGILKIEEELDKYEISDKPPSPTPTPPASEPPLDPKP